MRLPEGTVHLLEHVCVFAHIDGLVTKLDGLGVPLNGRVDRDRTCFWGGGFSSPTAASDIAGALVALMQVPGSVSYLEPLLQRVVGDVENEMGIRQHDESYWLSALVFRALYPDHALSASSLGTRMSLSRVDVAHVRVALSALRRALSHVIVYDKRADAPRIAAAVADVHAGLVRASWRPVFDPPPDIAAVRRISVVKDPPWYSPQVAGGFAVAPLRTAFLDPSQRARMLVITQALRERFSTRIGVECDEASRTYLVKVRLSEPWFVGHDYGPELRRCVIDVLAYLSRFFSGQFEAWLADIHESHDGFMRLLNAGLRHDLEPDQLLEALDEASTEDIDNLIAEVEQSDRTTQIYAGPQLVVE